MPNTIPNAVTFNAVRDFDGDGRSDNIVLFKDTNEAFIQYACAAKPLENLGRLRNLASGPRSADGGMAYDISAEYFSAHGYEIDIVRKDYGAGGSKNKPPIATLHVQSTRPDLVTGQVESASDRTAYTGWSLK